MSVNSKRKIMFITLILAPMIIPIFGKRKNIYIDDAAASGSGYGKCALFIANSPVDTVSLLLRSTVQLLTHRA